MRKLITLIMCTMFVLTTSAQQYLELVDSADIYIEQQQWVDAERLITMALKAEPANNNNSLLISNLATVQRNQYRYDDALKNYALALFMTPNAVTLLLNRGSLYMEIDSLDLAYDDYSRVVELESDNVEARYYHGMIAMQRDEMQVAKSDFDVILAKNSRNQFGNEAMALWFRLMKEYKLSLPYYDYLISIDNDNPDYYMSRAEARMGLNQISLASEDIGMAVKLAPEDGWIYLLRARLSELSYRDSEMEQDIMKAIELGVSAEDAKAYLNSFK